MFPNSKIVRSGDPGLHAPMASWGPGFGNCDNNRVYKETENNQPAAFNGTAIRTIPFVDAQKPVRDLFKIALEKFGYHILIAADGDEGLQQFRKKSVDLVITDLFMPKKDGYSLIVELLKEFPGAKIFAITGKHTQMGIETELDIAETLGAMRVFSKPVRISDLLNAINSIKETI